MGKFNSQPVQGMKNREIHKVFHKAKAGVPRSPICKSSVTWVLQTSLRNLSQAGPFSGFFALTDPIRSG